MYKKIIPIIIFVLLIIYFCYNQLNPIIISNHADISCLSTVAELEDSTEEIIKVKVSNGCENFIKKDNEKTSYSGYTITPVCVQKVYKGNNALKNRQIKIFEPCYIYDVPILAKKYIMTVENYRPLKVGNEYILFLKKMQDSEYYSFANLEQGKYIINTKLKEKVKSAETQSSLDIKDLNTDDFEIGELSENYVKFYKEIISKYGQCY